LNELEKTANDFLEATLNLEIAIDDAIASSKKRVEKYQQILESLKHVR